MRDPVSTQRHGTMRQALRALGLVFSALPVLVCLAGAAPAADTRDPPGRVGRLAFTEGTVSFHGADQDQWSPATPNWPVSSGQSFWTEPNSRAEIQVGNAEIRMDQSTELDVVRLEDGQLVVSVPVGTVNVHLRGDPDGAVQVQTPRGQVSLLKGGSYHVDAGHPNGDQPS